MDDFNISNNDIVIEGINYKKAKEMIRSAMKSKGITQTVLAKQILINQSEVSKYLNIDTEDFFRVDTLFRICSILDLSMDEITGLKDIQQTKHNKDTENKSLADMCEALCEVNSISPIHSEVVEISGSDRTVMYFEHSNISDMIKEISQINTLQGKEKILAIWKDNCIEENKERLRKFSFNTEQEYSDKLLKNWINAIRKTVEYEEHNIQDTDSPSCYNEMMIMKGANSNYDEAFSYFNRNDLNCMYKNVDRFIGNHNLSNIEHKSLTIFKDLYEHNSTL